MPRHVGLAPAPEARDRAAFALDRSGVRDGHCLALGLADGRLVEELVAQSELSVVAVDADPAKIDGLRRRWAAAGLHGTRIEAMVDDLRDVRLPPCFASLIVSESLSPAQLARTTSAARLQQVLRPLGGMLCLESTKTE